ncbi:FKBP-type peptidyl-prolyl cis-trans isomerase [Aquimarina sp. U1-2]|uniref:FKBP-type peptidyl-prolyl cis-trans isomerase n=1 Tax=Aquimarina sp. U1-2 TaxID=2823141 RepID=UPI001AEC93F5|nr:FKBP-type peptidyl-prolyl cis-trans isomerase [Aquimarina sp. U1-2]MBP2832320.1 FKBP-type peptidyl-prolyl cis-trans isomerase [Aquimarina sp. U1-2]
MNIIRHRIALGFILTIIFGCSNDDDRGSGVTPPRDRATQQIEDDEILQEYLKTHFYRFEDVFTNSDTIPEHREVVFDSIDENNSDKQSIIESGLVTTKKVNFAGIEYTYYVLTLDEGGGNTARVSDSVLVTYRGELPYSTGDKVFDESISPVSFDLAGNVFGFALGLDGIKAATSISDNGDGTITPSEDYGHVVVFMPSGLGYFNQPPSGSGIPPFSPLIFNIQLYVVNQADHDRDGIPSYLEDLNNDGNVSGIEDNTDQDNASNFADQDDDNDGTLTRDEITSIDLNEDGIIDPDPAMGELIFYDDDGDGTFNHLDPDDSEPKNEQ